MLTTTSHALAACLMRSSSRKCISDSTTTSLQLLLPAVLAAVLQELQQLPFDDDACEGVPVQRPGGIDGRTGITACAHDDSAVALAAPSIPVVE